MECGMPGSGDVDWRAPVSAAFTDAGHLQGELSPSSCLTTMILSIETDWNELQADDSTRHLPRSRELFAADLRTESRGPTIRGGAAEAPMGHQPVNAAISYSLFTSPLRHLGIIISARLFYSLVFHFAHLISAFFVYVLARLWNVRKFAMHIRTTWAIQRCTTASFSYVSTSSLLSLPLALCA